MNARVKFKCYMKTININQTLAIPLIEILDTSNDTYSFLEDFGTPVDTTFPDCAIEEIFPTTK